MMMRSNLLGLALILGVVVHATTPNAYFLQHQNGILQEKITQGAGFVYGVGRAKQASQSGVSKQIAKGKSELVATVNLLRREAMENVIWPEEVSSLNREIISAAYMKYLSITANVNGIQTLWQGFDSEGCVSVVCFPVSEAAKIRAPSFADIYKTLIKDEVFFSGMLSIETLISLRMTQENLPPEVERTQWDEILKCARFSTPRLRRLPQFAGRYPIGSCTTSYGSDYHQGMQAYQVGNLSEAYDLFLAEVEQTFAYDALNMAGNVARRIGKNSEAVALLLHAAYLNQNSPHPWVHLAFVAEANGMLELAENCCCMAEQRNLDNWSKEQIALIRSQIDVLCRENVVETLQ